MLESGEPGPEADIKRIAESFCRYALSDERGLGRAVRDLRDRADDIPMPATAPWLERVNEAAYYGLARRHRVDT